MSNNFIERLSISLANPQEYENHINLIVKEMNDAFLIFFLQ